MFCTRCGAELAERGRFCANCGAPADGTPPEEPTRAPSAEAEAAAPDPTRAPAEAPAQAEPVVAPPFAAVAPPPAASSTTGAQGQAQAPVTSIEVRRLGIGDLIALAGTIVLFVSLFLPWYSFSFDLGPFLSGISGGSIAALSEGAGGWRFLMVVVSVVVFVYLFARTTSRTGFRLPLPHWQLLTVLCGFNLLLALLALLIKPNEGVNIAGLSFDLSYGAYMGLSAAALAVVGSILRRSDPEVLPRESSTP